MSAARRRLHATPSLEAAVEAARARHRLPGLAALEYTGGDVAGVAVAGVRRAGDPAPLDPGDLLHVGSLTRAVTATMLGTLVAAGRLGWHSRLLELMPALRDDAHPGYAGVTVADLVDHRAGVRPWTAGRTVPGLRGRGFPGTPAQQRLAATRRLLARRPLVPHGRARYSNGGYVILAALAEHLARAPWEALVEDRVLRPLGVEPAFGWPLDAGAGQPCGHRRRRERYAPVEPGDHRLPAFLAPAGDLSLSLDGYARFGRLHLRGARGERTAVLDAAAVRRLQPEGDGQHAGWRGGTRRGVRFLGGEGSTGTFHAASLLAPDRDRDIVVVANAGGPGARRAVLGVALRILG